MLRKKNLPELLLMFSSSVLEWEEGADSGRRIALCLLTLEGVCEALLFRGSDDSGRGGSGIC